MTDEDPEPISPTAGHSQNEDVNAAVAWVREDDRSLVERAREGDERAFAQLYRRHARYLAGVIYRIMGDEQELDDVIQETFVDAADQLDQIRDAERVRPWLVRVAVRKVHRRLAKRRRLRWLHSERPSQPAFNDPEHRQELAALAETLEALAPKLRVPWVLHRVEGETLPAVAELCETSLATVKRRIAEAEEKIQRRLHGR